MPAAHPFGLFPHAAYAASNAAQSPALSLPVTRPEAKHPADAGGTRRAKTSTASSMHAIRGAPPIAVFLCFNSGIVLRQCTALPRLTSGFAHEAARHL